MKAKTAKVVLARRRYPANFGGRVLSQKKRGGKIDREKTMRGLQKPKGKKTGGGR